MKPFSKTYYTDKFNITVRIRRDNRDCNDARLIIKKPIRWKVRNYTYCKIDRVVYTYFPNDKNMFKEYEKILKKTKVPKKTRDEIVFDIKRNLFFEKVTTYVPLEQNEFLKNIL